MILSVGIPILFLTFIVIERMWPGRPLPKVSRWKLKGILFFALTGAVSATCPMLWTDWIRAHRLMDLEWLGTFGGFAAGLFVFELVGYLWHRVRHTSLFWWLHQLHHSAERLDVFGSALFHPLEIALNSFISSLVGFLVLGLSPSAAMLVGFFSVGMGIFQHANVRTPRWLGYFIQRPESHSVHHARGVHAFNYSNLPIIDMLFGTFKNPERFETEAGFWDGASERVGTMLIGRSVLMAVMLMLVGCAARGSIDAWGVEGTVERRGIDGVTTTTSFRGTRARALEGTGRSLSALRVPNR